MAKRVYKQAEETNEDKIRKIQALIWSHEDHIQKARDSIANYERQVATGFRTLQSQVGGKPHETVEFLTEKHNKFIVQYTGFIAELNAEISALSA